MSTRSRYILLAALIALVPLSTTSAQAQERAGDARSASADGASSEYGAIVDRIAARVQNTIITHTDITRALPIYIQVVGADTSLFQTSEGRQQLGEEVLAHLIETQLLLDKAESRGLPPTDREVNEFINRQREQLGLSESEFQRAMASEGIEFEDFREFTRGNLARLRMIQVDVVSRVSIDEEQIEQAMRERYPDGFQEIVIGTSHIFLSAPRGASSEQVDSAESRILELRSQLRSGEATFEELASEHNSDGSRRSGGRLGTTRLGELDTEFERAALSLDVGEYAGPVRTQFGFHIIRLDSREDRPVSDAAGLRERLEYSLREREIRNQTELYLERIQNEAYVEIVSADFGF